MKFCEYFKTLNTFILFKSFWLKFWFLLTIVCILPFICSWLWVLQKKTILGKHTQIILIFKCFTFIMCFFWKYIQTSYFEYQFSSVAQLCPTLSEPMNSQHGRTACPSPTPRVYPNSCPTSWWCHPAVSSSVVPFSSCPQSLPASGSFPMSQLFAWGGQSIGVSASASVLPMISFRMDWLDLLAVQGLSRVFSNTTVQKHQFFGAQLSSQSNSHIHTWPLEKPQPWLDGPLLAK